MNKWVLNDDSARGVERTLNEIDRYESDYNHHVKVILAKIIDRTYHPDFTINFNRNLDAIVSRRRSWGDDIILVDMQYGA